MKWSTARTGRMEFPLAAIGRTHRACGEVPIHCWPTILKKEKGGEEWERKRRRGKVRIGREMEKERKGVGEGKSNGEKR